MTDRELTQIIDEIVQLGLSRILDGYPEAQQRIVAIGRRLEAHRDELRKRKRAYQQVAGD